MGRVEAYFRGRDKIDFNRKITFKIGNFCLNIFIFIHFIYYRHQLLFDIFALSFILLIIGSYL